MTVRDDSALGQSAWHIESSDTPSGIWSSTEIKGLRSDIGGWHFYLLSYVPEGSSSGPGCHQIRAEVLRPKAEVFARDEYCTGQTPSDLLNGTREGRKLEHKLNQKGSGKIPLSVSVGALRSGAGKEERVDVALKFPWDKLDHSWDDVRGKLYASIGILGAVYSKDGTLVTRFSDLLYPPWWPTFVVGWQEENAPFFMPSDDKPGEGAFIDMDLRRRDPGWLPTRYETQFDLPPGEYTLRVVLSDGRKVGRAEAPLTIKNRDDKPLSLSSIFLCKRYRDAHAAAVERKAANFAPQYVPLVSNGVQVTPAGDTKFTPNQTMIAYFEIYAPRPAKGTAPGIHARMRIVDLKSGSILKRMDAVDVATYEQPGNSTIRIARKIPIANLRKGQYRLEIQATDDSGHTTPWRTASFSIE